MIKGLAAEDSDRALDRLRRGRALPSWFPLDEVDLGGSHCVDRDGAQLGHSAPRCHRRQANRRRLRQLDHAVGTCMASTPSTQSRSPTRGRSVGLLNQLRERALASVEDPNTTPAISSGALKDGCTVDDWDAITQGTPGSVTRSRTKRSCHSVVMDPPRGVQDRGDVPERPVARRTRLPLAWSPARPPRPSRAPRAFTDHEPEAGSPRVFVTQCRGLIRWSRRGKSNRLRAATGWT
jgi:hypothetical protein